MIIRCPKCETAFKVSDDAVNGTAPPSFRCSRCKNIFDLPFEDRTSAAVPRAIAGAAPRATQTQPELSFTFPLSDSIKTDPEEEKIEVPPDLPERERETAALPQSRDANPNVYSLQTFRDQPASTKPYLGLLVLLVLFFSFITAYQQVHPKASDDVIGKIPLLGSSVLHNPHLKNGVLLKSLRGGYQTIQGNREVFVVSGEALNQNPVVIRRVQIAGQLYDQEGKAIEHQVIWVGNAISAKIVRGMSAQDVIDLQRLQPLKSFDIPPGDTVPFTIVFFKPSKAVKDFSCEVQSAEVVG
jgi:predicted Zn finger-like uncharacterized protein